MEIKAGEYDAVNAVHVFRDEFSESLSDTHNQIYWEIVGDPLSANEDDEMRPDRLLNLYIEILIEAETEHRETGKKFDDCLDVLLSEANHKSTETSLSAAWASILKAQFHYFNGQMHLALRELIKANFCFGVYIGNYNFSFKYSKSQANGGNIQWKDWNNLRIEVIRYYLDNIELFKRKKNIAANEMEKTGLFKIKEKDVVNQLNFDQIYLILKGDVVKKLNELEKNKSNY